MFNYKAGSHFFTIEEFLFNNWLFSSLKLIDFLEIILIYLGLIVPLLISVAFFTLIERKIMASIQRRHGPNTIGWSGLLQPFADGLKLLLKESIYQVVQIKEFFYLLLF